MDDTPHASLASAVFYSDPWTALDWLERAFGFERSMVITNPDGTLGHSQLRFGNGYLMVGGEWAEHTASPSKVGGKNTQSLHVHLSGDVDRHCEKARAVGAVILMEPANQFYGDRTYRARDPEGHVWTFAQTVAPFSVEESEKATGLSIKLFP